MAEVVFFIAAIGAIAGAVGTVAMRNPFFSVLALVAHLLCLAPRRESRMVRAVMELAQPAPSARPPRYPRAPAPAPTTTNDVPAATPTTVPYERSPTASSASSTAASPTAPSTTNTSPGTTGLKLPLDSFSPWDV